MARWKSLLGALMLVLMLWTGGMAHAAERFDCMPTTSEAADHFDGDGDEAPSGRDQGVAHHHSGCSGHHVAAPSDAVSNLFEATAVSAQFAWREMGVPGRGPDAQLRPPIA